MDHALAILIIALVARGVAFTLTEGAIFGRAGTWYLTRTEGQKYWLHPFGFCSKCSVWLFGTPAIWALDMMPDTLWMLPIYWLCAAGLIDLLDP